MFFTNKYETMSPTGHKFIIFKGKNIVLIIDNTHSDLLTNLELNL